MKTLNPFAYEQLRLAGYDQNGRAGEPGDPAFFLNSRTPLSDVG